MPAPISDRLDTLVKRLEYVDREKGEVNRGTSRKELLAALILDVPADKRALNRKLSRSPRGTGREHRPRSRER